MFTVRNERMAKRLDEYFKTFKNETIFVAIGAGKSLIFYKQVLN